MAGPGGRVRRLLRTPPDRFEIFLPAFRSARLRRELRAGGACRGLIIRNQAHDTGGETMGVRTSFRQGLLCAAAIITTMAMPADTLALEPAEFTIEAAPLGDALRAFSQQSGRAILFSEGAVSGLAAPRLTGPYEPEAALTLLLQGTGLEFTQGPNGNLIVRRQTGADPVQTPEPGRGRGREVQGEPDPEIDSRRIETITVTGTSIRGIAPESSPLFVFDREEILSSGLTTTEQFIRSLPQNSGSGSSEYIVLGLPGDSGSARNDTLGTSANLRGLGSRGTLVLLNGSRLAPTSQIGDFVDLSLIPISALERIEVLPDGASSIYGGDAVAGVINFILRDDFDGAETSARFGTVTQGDMKEIRLSQAIGRSWSSGNVLGTYEYFDRDRLRLSDRPFVDLFEPRSASVTLPSRDEYYLLPSQTRHSGVVSLQQQISPRMSMRGMALYSSRRSDTNYFNQSATVVSHHAQSDSLSATLGLDYDLSANWMATVEVAHSEIKNRSERNSIFLASGGITSDVENRTRSSVSAVDLKVDGPLFELPAGPVSLALGGHFREEDFRDEQVGASLNSEGVREVLAGFGEIMLPIVSRDNQIPLVRQFEINLSARAERYSDHGTRISPKVGILWAVNDAFRFRGSYSESFAPPPLGTAFSLSRSAFIGPYQLVVLNRIGEQSPDPRLTNADWMGLSGTVPGLNAETSRTYTAGFDYTYRQGPHSWSARGTYYNIRFEDRLGSIPVPGGLSSEYTTLIAWNDPSAFPEGTVIFFPTMSQIEEVLASLQMPADIFPGSAIENVGVIDSRLMVRNLAITETDGVDVTVSYQVEAGDTTFTIGANGNYINNFTEQATPTSPTVRSLNTLYKPVDLQLRAYVGISRHNLASTLYLNRVASYRSNLTASSVPIDSWTTLDLTASYEITRPESWLNGTTLGFAVNNLLDQQPPVTPTNSGSAIGGFDPVNASALGRFAALEIRKRF